MTRTTRGGARPRTTWTERAVVLGGFAPAAFCTAWSARRRGRHRNGGRRVAGREPPGHSLSSLVLALRRGLRHRDWRAFGGYEMTDGTELVDWSTKSGAWFDMALAEENERLMRGD